MRQNETLTAQELHNLEHNAPQITPSAQVSRQSGFVRVLSSVDRDLLREIMSEINLPRGTVLFREGDAGDSMFLIWAGRLAVFKGDVNQPDVLVHRSPGDVVGEMSLLNDKPRSATVVVVEAARLLQIDRAGFSTLISRDPAISITIMAQLSNRLRDSQNFNSQNMQAGRELVEKVTSLRNENEQLLRRQQNYIETNELIVHDLRNPLGNMYSALNMLELVLPDEVMAENAELISIAHLSLLRMQRLVDSLLDISRLDNKTITPKYQMVNLIELINDAILANQFTLEQRGMDVITHFLDEKLVAWMDEVLISRVLINMIENGIKYTEGDAPLEVFVTQNETEIHVAIEDHGRGIPPDKRDEIFERFVQSATHGRRPPGFGLGLAFCRLAVEAHNGRIWVENAHSGKGSRFVFTLPLKD